MSDRDWTFPGCPSPEDPSVDWAMLEARFAWLRALAGCPQDPVFHREGDVLTHTRMVVERLVATEEWRALGAADRQVVFTAALLHDAGKPAVTVVDPLSGRVSSRGHAARGARMARRLLYRGEGAEPAPFAAREAIVGLVRHHGLPLQAIERADPARAVIAASQTARLDHVALLARADVEGRECGDRQALLDRVALFHVLCVENACFVGPRAFPSDLARFHYFVENGRDPDYAPFDDRRCEVVVMAGLPGAGKTRHVETHPRGWPVVRLDDLRAALDVDPADDQGTVVSRAYELARIHLRAARSFVWDATNVSRQMRARIVRLCADYRARVRVVYVERPYDAIVRRNRGRATSLPGAVIERLVDRLDVPDLTEAHQVEWVVSN